MLKLLPDPELVSNWNEFRTMIQPSLQRALFDYWCSLWRDGTMPARKDIDPIDIPRLLPHVGLIDVLPGPAFRYRLIGSAMVDTYKTDFTGRELFEAKSGAYAEALYDMYCDCAASKSPIYSRARFIYPKGVISELADSGLDTQRLLLPLSANNHDVDMLLYSMIAVRSDESMYLQYRVIDDSIGFIEDLRVRT